jgi:hypothetical protein
VASEYVGQAFVVDADGAEVEVRASLRIEPDGWWGGDLVGPANWLRMASSTPVFEFALPDRRVGAAFVSEFNQADTMQRVTIAGMGAAPFGGPTPCAVGGGDAGDTRGPRARDAHSGWGADVNDRPEWQRQDVFDRRRKALQVLAAAAVEVLLLLGAFGVGPMTMSSISVPGRVVLVAVVSIPFGLLASLSVTLVIGCVLLLAHVLPASINVADRWLEDHS